MRKWLISANPNKFNHRAAFAKWGYVDWKQYANYAVGDIVYIYASRNEAIIKYKTVVTKCNMNFSEIDNDESFWLGKPGFNREKAKYSRLKLLKHIDNDDLKYRVLLEHGLKNAPEGAMELKGELLKYIESQESRMELLCQRVNPSVSIEESVRQRAEEFTRYIHTLDHSDGPINFSSPHSVTRQEQYKKRLFDRAKARMNIGAWERSWIGTGKIYRAIEPIITDQDNNIIWHSSQPELLKKFHGSSGDYNAKAEKAIFEIYNGNNDHQAFDEAVSCFERNYSTISYFFFLKDDNRYLPITPGRFEEAFRQFNISIKLRNECSWENYNTFIQIVDSIRELMPYYLQLEHTPTLLEAHSFIWMVGTKEFSDWLHNNQKYITAIEEEQRKQKLIANREANQVPMKALSEFTDEELRAIGPKFEGKVIYSTRYGNVLLVRFYAEPLSIDISIQDDETKEYGEAEKKILSPEARKNYKVYSEVLDSILSDDQAGNAFDVSGSNKDDGSEQTAADNSQYVLTHKQQLVESMNGYVQVHGTNDVLDGSTILKISNLTEYAGSIFPSDFCYNRYNVALKGFDGPFLFEYLGTDSYKVLGEGYPYSGMVYHKPKGGTEQIVGYWTNGVFVLSEKKQAKEPLKVSREEIESSEELEREYQVDHESEIPPVQEDYSYDPSPEKRLEVTTPPNSRGVVSYPRSQQKRENALYRANYQCECGNDHKTFISKRTDRPYVEVHHLVPLEYWRYFENSLDVEANIVCLCSNCHNEIHYGKNAIGLVMQLYNLRKEELSAAGIDINLEDLVDLYQ